MSATTFTRIKFCDTGEKGVSVITVDFRGMFWIVGSYGMNEGPAGIADLFLRRGGFHRIGGRGGFLNGDGGGRGNGRGRGRGNCSGCGCASSSSSSTGGLRPCGNRSLGTWALVTVTVTMGDGLGLS